VQSPVLALLTACSLTLAAAIPSRAEPATQADLPKLIAEAATYESGQSAEPLWKIEQLLRDSPANRPCGPTSKPP